MKLKMPCQLILRRLQSSPSIKGVGLHNAIACSRKTIIVSLVVPRRNLQSYVYVAGAAASLFGLFGVFFFGFFFGVSFYGFISTSTIVSQGRSVSDLAGNKPFVQRPRK